MGWMDNVRRVVLGEQRSDPAITLDDWATWMSYQGNVYGAPFLNQTLGGTKEDIPAGYTGMVQNGYQRNAVVFAVEQVRVQLFSEARFQFQQMRGGRPGDLFGGPGLRVLEKPWYGGTTGDLLTRMLMDADFGGSAFLVRRGGSSVRNPPRIRRLRPDWTTMVLGSDDVGSTVEGGDVDADLIGLIYHPGGPYSGRDAQIFTLGEFAHFAPMPDPLATYRGMAWLTPILREMAADSAATTHKLKFFENGATPNMVVKFDPTVGIQQARDWRKEFERKSKGLANAYQAMYLGGGADATVVGTNFQQLDFKVTQGAGETRIAAAGGVPPVVVGLSEGLQGSSLNAGNYGQAKRKLADLTMRPLWRNAAGSIEAIVPPPDAGSRLWYDDRDIPFLKQDLMDRAQIQQTQAVTINQYIVAGFTPKSAVLAVENDDNGLLEHTGLVSVQLQEPGAQPDQGGTPPTDGGPAGG